MIRIKVFRLQTRDYGVQISLWCGAWSEYLMEMPKDTDRSFNFLNLKKKNDEN